MIVLQGLVIDHVDDGDYEGPGLLVYPRKQRLQPARVALAVAVQEEDHVPGGGPGPRQPRPDQPLPLLQPLQLYRAREVLLDVSLKFSLKKEASYTNKNIFSSGNCNRISVL